MKKLSITLAFALLVAGVANAQEGHTRTAAERAKAQTARMTGQLGLDAGEQERVAVINQAYAEKGAALRKARKAEAERSKGEFKELHNARMEELKQVLTPEQYTKLEALQQEKRKKRMERGKRMRQERQPGSGE